MVLQIQFGEKSVKFDRFIHAEFINLFAYLLPASMNFRAFSNPFGSSSLMISRNISDPMNACLYPVTKEQVGSKISVHALYFIRRKQKFPMNLQRLTITIAFRYSSSPHVTRTVGHTAVNVKKNGNTCFWSIDWLTDDW